MDSRRDSAAREADSSPGTSRRLDECSSGELEYFLFMAEASQEAYADSPEGLVEMPGGMAAMLYENADGDVAIAFRGSVIGDRQRRHPFSSLGGQAMRRTYQDWAATNLKQAGGFLPRQYLDGAALVAQKAASLQPDRQLFVTGHSKGGGMAEFAMVAAYANPDLSPEQKDRIRCVTFNAAPIQAGTWKRLLRQFRGLDQQKLRHDLNKPGKIIRIRMEDDPVSKIGAPEHPDFGSEIVIIPHEEIGAFRQHGMDTVIPEITRLLQ